MELLSRVRCNGKIYDRVLLPILQCIIWWVELSVLYDHTVTMLCPPFVIYVYFKFNPKTVLFSKLTCVGLDLLFPDNYHIVRFGIFKAALLRIYIAWDVKPCRLVNVYLHGAVVPACCSSSMLQFQYAVVPVCCNFSMLQFSVIYFQYDVVPVCCSSSMLQFQYAINLVCCSSV